MAKIPNSPRFERTSITLPEGTIERARRVGINISAMAAIAVLKAINLLEKGDETQ